MAKASAYLKGCALGCGGVLLLVIVLVAGWVVSVRGLSNRAVDLRDRLEATLPDQYSFTPSADGAIAADRVDRFLRVRERLMSFCRDFTELGDEIQTVDDHVTDLEASNDPAFGDLLEVLSGAGRISRGMIAIGSELGEYSVARNEALLEEEMGLGEYTWIYAVTYFSWLGHQPTKFALSEEDYPRIFQDRVSGNLRQMLRRQLSAADRGADASASIADEEARAHLALLRDEVLALDGDPQRLLFAEGLPTALESSLEPYRTELESVYCPATSELDFMRTEGSGLAHDHL